MGSWEALGQQQDTLWSPAPCSCQRPAASLLLALVSRPQPHPWSHGSLLHHSLPSSVLNPLLPSQSFCFPSLEGNGSEAQVSKVEKQFLPLQIALTLFCCLIPTDSAHWVQGPWLRPGPPWWPMGPPGALPTAPWLHSWVQETKAFPGVLSAPLGSASANWASTKLQLQSGLLHSTRALQSSAPERQVHELCPMCGSLSSIPSAAEVKLKVS